MILYSSPYLANMEHDISLDKYTTSDRIFLVLGRRVKILAVTE